MRLKDSFPSLWQQKLRWRGDSARTLEFAQCGPAFIIKIAPKIAQCGPAIIIKITPKIAQCGPAIIIKITPKTTQCGSAIIIKITPEFAQCGSAIIIKITPKIAQCGPAIIINFYAESKLFLTVERCERDSRPDGHHEVDDGEPVRDERNEVVELVRTVHRETEEDD